jgi:flagellar biosynthesis component FlhA
MPFQLWTEAKRQLDRLRVGFWASSIIVLWVVIVHRVLGMLTRKPAEGALPEVSDLIAVTFGATPLAMFTFSLIFAVAAIVQWQSFKRDIREQLSEAREAIQEARRSASKENEERIRELEERVANRIGELEMSFQEEMERSMKELRARVHAIMGVAIGSLHSDPLEPLKRGRKSLYCGGYLPH